ncbi:MAG: response regulator [Alphaproteobacteria bacterium]|nr:response regulator [Alphaproteobacteria bacterium]
MSLRLPQGFGPFQLLHRVAVGATAELYAASRPSDGSMAPASIVKLFPEVPLGQPAPLHYRTEVEIGRRVEHPTLVRQFSAGQSSGHPWIEMEWVEGKSLRQLMRKLARGRRKLPLSLAIFIIREVCRALDTLHRLEDDSGGRLDLVHGDLSPGNILIGYDGRVKLGDFGDVCLAGDRPDPDQERPKGQLRYMSPELALSEPLSQASDLFSLGAVLHEALTGQPLFAGGTESILLTRVKGAEVDPPSLANPHIPPNLDRLVMTTLAPYPDERPPSARALWLGLSEFGGEEGSEADGDLLSKVMLKLFQKERAVERSRIASALELLREAEPAQPPPPRHEPPPPDDEDDDDLEDVVSAVRSSQEPPSEPPSQPPKRSRMSLALLSPFQGGGLEAVVVPEIPRAMQEPLVVERPSPRRAEPRPPVAEPPPVEPQVRGPRRPPRLSPEAAPPAEPPRAVRTLKPAELPPPPGARQHEPRRAAAELPPPPPPPPEEEPASKPGATAAALLIVDSDTDAREHFGRQFRKAGYHVDLAEDGVAAMDMVFKRNYDLVLMATRMPRPNGIQVLKGIRRTWSPPELPVILTSTHNRSQDVLKALSLGANELVSKGIEFNVLHARVRTQIMLKLTYEALQATEARYDALVDHSSDMVFHLAPDGRIVFVSSACRAMLGYSPQSLVGRSLLSVIHRPDAMVLRDQAHSGELLPEGDDINFRMAHRDRSLIWVRCQVRITRDRRTGAVSEIHGTCREQPPDSIGDDLPPDEVAMRVEPGVELGRVAEALTHVGLGVVQGPGGPNDLRVVPLNGPRSEGR